MAIDDLDTTFLKEWEDAFQQPIPSIRKLEVRLRGDAEANRQKLRTIVGSSYRDLLGTADRIIEMDKQMKAVENGLGTAGQKCNVKSIERIFASTRNFDQLHNNKSMLYQLYIACHLTVSVKSSYALASHMTLLQRATSVISRMLKCAGSPLVAAKVLVLSRLLHKVISQSQSESDLLESLRKRLAALRRKLLSVINQKLGDSDADWKVLVDHMCAFSLTTSATPTEILRHFHHVRLQAIESCLNDDDHRKADPTRAVKLLVNTSKVSQTIFPKRLADALGKLKGVPLLQQSDVTNLVELELDVHARWIAEELQNYTPWPRHDELQKPEADKQLRNWTRQAVKTFVGGLQKSLSGMTQFSEVVQARKAIFTSWPWSGRGLPGLDTEEIVDELREIINDKMIAIIKSALDDLAGVLSHASLAEHAKDSQPPTLWSSDLVSVDASAGAASFKQSLIRAYHGDDPVSHAVISAYDKWIEDITSVMIGIQNLKEDRWDIEFEEDDEDADGESRRTLLREDDPRELEDTLATTLRRTVENFREDCQALSEKARSSEFALERCIVYLRIFRELSRRSIGEGFSRKLQITPRIESDLLLPLQERLAAQALKAPIEEYQSNLKRFGDTSKVAGKLLWEGSPPLPMQPSTTTYRFMREVNKSMTQLGSDIWSSGTIQILKSNALRQVRNALAVTVKEISASRLENQVLSNGHDKTSAEEVQHGDSETTANGSSDNKVESEALVPTVKGDGGVRNDKAVQTLFDYFYARSAFVVGTPDEDAPEKEFLSILRDLTDALESSDLSRLEKHATEYWKRSYLMFALLSE